MKIKALAYLALPFLINIASAQSLYLTCKATAWPDLNFKTIYKVPPANTRDQFLRDSMYEGFAGVIVNKAESWEINIAEGRISSPEENSGPKFTDAAITKTGISAIAHLPYGGSYYFDLNRITGKLVYRIYLAEEATKPWHAKHGGTFPSVWRWEQLCTSASRPKL